MTKKDEKQKESKEKQKKSKKFEKYEKNQEYDDLMRKISSNIEQAIEEVNSKYEGTGYPEDKYLPDVQISIQKEVSRSRPIVKNFCITNGYDVGDVDALIKHALSDASRKIMFKPE
jgi:hypothetical protein